MAATVKHSFVSAIPDDPAAAAAGQVTPSNWNAEHVISGVVTSVATTAPLTGGPITTTGTIGLGNVPITNLNSGTGATSTTFWRGDGTWATPAGAVGSNNPGGVPTNLQYNNAGVFGGMTGFNYAHGGLNVNITNPNATNDPNSATGLSLSVSVDNLITNPSFTDLVGLSIQHNVLHGMNTYNFDASGTTQAKITSIANSVFMTAPGAGQRILNSWRMDAWGFSDSFMISGWLAYASGPINGDEGIGFSPAEFGIQQANVVNNYAHITNATVRTAFTTTITQAITGSKSPQTITVASTTGANVNDWIIFNQALTTDQTNIAAAMITAVNPGVSITCVCPNNYTVGVTITPATVLVTDTSYQMGEYRVLVNLSHADYHTGQIYKAWPLVGVGTTWTNAMVGGSATNIGAISIDQDIFSDSTIGSFSGVPLNSWWQINGLPSTTTLFTHGMTSFGIKQYDGNAPAQAELFSAACTISIASPGVFTMVTGTAPKLGTAVRLSTTGTLPTGLTAGKTYWVSSPSGATFHLSSNSDSTSATAVNTSGTQSGTHTVFNGGYTIKPCARILWINPPNYSAPGTVLICETSTAAWNIGDNLECVICPYSYVSGWNYSFAHWNPGATLVDGVNIQNFGARKFQAAFSTQAFGTIGRTNSDKFGFGYGLYCSGCEIGIGYQAPIGGGGPFAQIIWDNTTPLSKSGAIMWSPGAFIAPFGDPGGSGTVGLALGMTFIEGSEGAGGTLALVPGQRNAEGIQPELAWNGYLALYTGGSGHRPFIRISGSSGFAMPETVDHTIFDISGSSAGSPITNGTALHFLSYDDSANPFISFAIGQANPIVGFGAANPGGGQGSQGSATSNTTNRHSLSFVQQASVWDGSAAQARRAQFVVRPEQGVNNAKISWYLAIDYPGNSYSAAQPNFPFAVREDGLITLGQNPILGGPVIAPLSLDPVAYLTAARTVTFPDVSGASGVIVPGTHTPASSTAAGTPGQIEFDSGFLYVCVASNTWIRSALTGGW